MKSARKTLRDHQKNDHHRICAALTTHRRVIYVCPTGGGKTVLFSHFVAGEVRQGKRVFIVVPKVELQDQARKHIAEELGVREKTIGSMGGGGPDLNPAALVQVCTIQTLVKRVRTQGLTGDTIVVDECHHSAADSYQEVLASPGFANAKLLGVTATPERLDRKLMASDYDVMVNGLTMRELVALGYLSEPLHYAPDRSQLADLRKVKKVRGDFDSNEVAKRLIPLVGNVVDHWKRHAPKGPDARTLVFAVNRAHSDSLVKAFESADVGRVKYIDCYTKKEVRRQIIDDFRSGVVSILVNVGIVSEGFDLADISCIAIARPTASRNLYVQMCGRGTRVGAERCVILDHSGNTNRFGKVIDYAPPGLDEQPPVVVGTAQSPVRRCPNCDAQVAAGSIKCTECEYLFRTEDEILTCDGELSLFQPEERQTHCSYGCGKLAPRSAFAPSVVRKRGVPWRCQPCRASHQMASLTQEQRQKQMRWAKASMTQEQKTAWREAARNGIASVTPERRSEARRKGNAARTQKERSEAARKAWETRRAKAAQKATAAE